MWEWEWEHVHEQRTSTYTVFYRKAKIFSPCNYNLKSKISRTNRCSVAPVPPRRHWSREITVPSNAVTVSCRLYVRAVSWDQGCRSGGLRRRQWSRWSVVIVTIRPSGDQIAQCPNPSHNDGVSYKMYIYLHVCTTHNSSWVSLSTSWHPDIDSPTSSYRHTARSVAVRHTPWLRPLRTFP